LGKVGANPVLLVQVVQDPEYFPFNVAEHGSSPPKQTFVLILRGSSEMMQWGICGENREVLEMLLRIPQQTPPKSQANDRV
jgi:hypothetical protein